MPAIYADPHEDQSTTGIQYGLKPYNSMVVIQCHPQCLLEFVFKACKAPF